ncbi:MAG: hypothetical protein ABSE73_08395 [Planctomycetota bacterium]
MLGLTRKGRICLRKAKKAVKITCPKAHPDMREELISRLMPGLWHRVRKWKPGPKSFGEYAENAAFQSLKDAFRKWHSSRDALDRRAAPLDDFTGLY